MKLFALPSESLSIPVRLEVVLSRISIKVLIDVYAFESEVYQKRSTTRKLKRSLKVRLSISPPEDHGRSIAVWVHRSIPLPVSSSSINHRVRRRHPSLPSRCRSLGSAGSVAFVWIAAVGLLSRPCTPWLRPCRLDCAWHAVSRTSQLWYRFACGCHHVSFPPGILPDMNSPAPSPAPSCHVTSYSHHQYMPYRSVAAGRVKGLKDL